MANKFILLVEDNEDNSKLVRFLLERAGYEIMEARTGQQGMDMAHTEKPDMILMDLSLPDVDGWTAARELKSGFDGYLSKPINVHSFASAIPECLKAYNKPEE